MSLLTKLTTLLAKLITATRMYHLCHVFYQQLPRNLPLAAVTRLPIEKRQGF